jgi:hypothetical protein
LRRRLRGSALGGGARRLADHEVAGRGDAIRLANAGGIADLDFVDVAFLG